jgi:hypothetical protein
MANSTTIYRLSDGRNAVDVTENKTLDDTQCGVVQVVKTDAITITLPATVVGYNYTIKNGGVKATGTPTGAAADGSAIVTVSPNANDKIAGLGFTATDNKDIINTKATSKIGDEVTLIGDGANGWMVNKCVGVWASE